jgi:hypothetical protein
MRKLFETILSRKMSEFVQFLFHLKSAHKDVREEAANPDRIESVCPLDRSRHDLPLAVAVAVAGEHSTAQHGTTEHS